MHKTTTIPPWRPCLFAFRAALHLITTTTNRPIPTTKMNSTRPRQHHGTDHLGACTYSAERTAREYGAEGHSMDVRTRNDVVVINRHQSVQSLESKRFVLAPGPHTKYPMQRYIRDFDNLQALFVNGRPTSPSEVYLLVCLFTAASSEPAIGPLNTLG